MDRKKLLLIGGGGHCKSVLDSLLGTGNYSNIGIVDVKDNIGKSIMDVPVIGCDDELERLYMKGYSYAFVSIGSVGNPKLRIKIFQKLESIGFEIPNIIDPSANISKRVSLAVGIYIGKNTVINVGTSIGKGAIINTASTVEHECNIGEFVHIASGTVLCGEVQIGNFTHVGAKSVVKQQVKVGVNTLIGMGSVVLNDVSDGVIAYGNPCKEIRTR
jgi:sugar O-acyltransferase (sialic acid O-acetyltransferase NeuD family)